ncbi:MAG: cysteine synthase A [Muribaculaceae bacterium]|nr:cysteine synthase A [Muribaculaceae bacterium]
MNVADNLTELIGRTPLLQASRLAEKLGLNARLLLKLESFNPGGSVKDRVALSMVEAAEAAGILKPGATIIEPTSGNTGIGLAWVATVKGYKLILTMPETMSIERRKLLAGLGATLELTPGAEGMTGAIARAEQLRDQTPGSVILSQFDNPANPEAHYRTTAREIWDDTDGRLDIFVACVGTGGTVSGTARGLKERNQEIQAVAVEPAGSPVISGGKPGPHKIQGIGAGFVPGNYDSGVIDSVMTVADDEAFDCARLLAATEGLLAGISSGAAIAAAIRLARLPENAGKTIVALLPDTGERYLSTPLFG